MQQTENHQGNSDVSQDTPKIVGNEDFISLVNKLSKNDTFPHTLLWGPSGAGKTTIAKYIAKVTGQTVESYYAPELSKMILTLVLTGLSENDIIIIDEIHAMKQGMLESIYQPLEEGKFQGERLPKFTFIGITTDLSHLTDALIRRFRLVYRVNLYNIPELVAVLTGLCRSDIEEDALLAVAMMSRGSPGIARNHLEIIEEINEGVITAHVVFEYQRLKHIDLHGLEDIDIEYLRALKLHGTLSLSTVSSVLVEREDAIERNIEPFLFRQGLVIKSPKGRLLTPAGTSYLLEYHS